MSKSMLYNTKNLNDYLNNLNFKLKNEDRTLEKWSGYKTAKWYDLLSYVAGDYNSLIEDTNFFRSTLNLETSSSLLEVSYKGVLFRNLFENFNRQNIRRLMPLINSSVYNYNKGWLSQRYLSLEIKRDNPPFNGLNNNERTGFTTRLYLYFYPKLNASMKEILKSIVYDIYTLKTGKKIFSDVILAPIKIKEEQTGQLFLDF